MAATKEWDYSGGSIICKDVSGNGAGLTSISRTTGVAAGTVAHVLIDDGTTGLMSSEAQLALLRGGLGLPPGASAADGWTQLDQTLGGTALGIVPAIGGAAPHSAFTPVGYARDAYPGTLVLRDSGGGISTGLPVVHESSGEYLIRTSGDQVVTTGAAAATLIAIDMAGATFGPNNYMARAMVVARGPSGAYGAAFELEARGAVPGDGSAVSLVGMQSSASGDAPMANATAAFSASAVPGSLAVVVCSDLAATSVRWACLVDTVQVHAP